MNSLILNFAYNSGYETTTKTLPTILMPCLNEAETIGVCVSRPSDSSMKAELMAKSIADNGSEDGSQMLATDLGARVIDVPQRGYGAA